MTKMLAIGDTILGKYEVEDIRCIGGQGILAKGKDAKTGQDVAIKQLLASSDQTNYPELIARAEREAQVRIGHPNVVDPIDSGSENGEFYIIFPYVEGDDLATYLGRQGKKLTPDEATRIVRDIAEGLSSVHAKGFVHRDMKPQNVLIDPNGRALIVDFGITRDTNGVSIVQPGSLRGTLGYMSPEQVGSPGTEDHRTDLYSLGVVFYELLTGKFTVQDGTAKSILTGICQYIPPSPRQLDGSIPEHIDRACMGLLVKQREARFQSAEEFIQALNGQAHASPASFCISCGQRTDVSAAYCMTCGAPQNVSCASVLRCLACGCPAPDVQTCPSCGKQFSPVEHRLTFKTGPLSGQTFRIPQGAFFVGREQLSARDQLLSRRHFSVSCNNGTVEVQDAGSTNGTFLGGCPISGPTALTQGVQFHIAGNVADYTCQP